MLLKIKLIIFVLVTVVSGCANDQLVKRGDRQDVRQNTEQTQSASVARPVAEKAMAMHAQETHEEVYSLYGIALGESKSSVEKKYTLIACREDIFYLRCALLLDTTDVLGVSASNKVMIFIAFKNNDVYSMSLPIFADASAQTKVLLKQLYADPDVVADSKISWSNASGSVVLAINSNAMLAGSLIYSVD